MSHELQDAKHEITKVRPQQASSLGFGVALGLRLLLVKVVHFYKTAAV